MIQTRRDAANDTADEALSPVRSLELVVGADAPVHAPVDAPVDAPVGAPVDAPVNATVDATVEPVDEPVLDRTGLTEEEVHHLPGDLRALHTYLINAPEDMTDITFPIPRGIFLHDGREVVLPFKEFNDFLQAASSDDKWLDVGVITVFLMLVTKNYLYHVYSTQIYIPM